MIQEGAKTGAIYVTSSLVSKLKSYVDSWSYTDGQNIEYFNPNSYGTMNYTTLENKSFWTMPAPQGSFTGDVTMGKYSP